MIEDDDLEVVDTGKTNYANGGVFLLTINNNWFIKHLRVTGGVDIISDNPKYSIETLSPDTDVEIKVIGKIINNLAKFG